MNDNEARVRIVADATGVRPGTEKAKSEIGELGPALAQLNSRFAEMSTMMRQTMAQGATSAEQMTREMRQLEVQTERESRALAEMNARIEQGLMSLGGWKSRIGNVFAGFIAGFSVQQVVDFSKRMGEAAEKTALLSQRLGITTSDVQMLGALAEITASDVDKLAGAMAKLDRTFASAKEGGKSQAAAFKQIGVDVQGNYTQMQLLQAVMGRFSEMADGPAKVALAMQLLGRSGAELIPVLSMSKEEQDQFNQKLAYYGVISEEAIAKGNQLADAWDDNALAMKGLENAMTDAMAPAMATLVEGLNGFIAQCVRSYNAGGVVAQVMDIMGFAIKSVVSILVAFGAAADFTFKTISGAAYGLAGILMSVFDGIVAGVKITGSAFVTFGAVIYEALNLNWGGIKAQFAAGLNDITRMTREAGQQISANLSAGFAAGSAQWSAADKNWMAADAWVKKLWNPGPAPKITPSVGGTTGDIVAGGGGKDKGKDSDARMTKWEAELERQKMAIAALADAEQTFREMSKADEAAYWGALLERTDLSQQERLDIEKKYYSLRRDIRREEYDVQIAALGRELEAARGNAAERTRIATQIAEFVKSKHGEDSREYRQAQDRIVQIARESAEQRRRIELDLIRAEQQMRIDAIDDARDAARFRVEMGVQTNLELLRQEREFERQRFAIQMQALRAQQALVDPSKDPERYGQINNQIVALERQHQIRLLQIERAATLERTLIQRNAINSTAQLWGQNISRLLTLQQSFGETIRNLYIGMVGVVADALAQIIANWIAKKLAALILGNAAEKASGVATIATEAAKAGAGGTASMAAAPFPLNLGAPAFGAAMAGIAMGYQSLLAVPGFAVGAKNLSRDQLAVVHAGETIIPAAEAGGWRKVMELFAAMPRLNLSPTLSSPLSAGFAPANSNAPFADNDRGGDGGTHYHFHGDIKAWDGKSVKQMLKSHATDVAAAADAGARQGYRPSSTT